MSSIMEIGNIAPFDCKSNPTSVGPRWKRWKRSFEFFLVAKGVEKDPQRKALLLHCAGSDVQDIYHTLTDPGPVGEDDKEYDKAMRTLDHYFAPQVNVPFERHQFRQATKLTKKSQKLLINLSQDCFNSLKIAILAIKNLNTSVIS